MPQLLKAGASPDRIEHLGFLTFVGTFLPFANFSRQDQPCLGRLDMSDHSDIQYSTSDGMDYPAHEQQYQTFVKIGVTATAVVVAIVVLMAIFLT